MNDEGLTLEQISECSGVEPRTLRSWVSEGLLSPPFRAGRGATYPASNASRALAVRALKNVYGLSLTEIRLRFMTAKEEQITAWALEAGEAVATPGAARAYIRMVLAREHANEAAAADNRPSRRGTSVASSRRPGGVSSASNRRPGEAPGVSNRRPDRAPDVSNRRYRRTPADNADEQWVRPSHRHVERAGDLAALEHLILQLEHLHNAQAPRRSRGDIWTRISITPDLELSIRGELEPRERVLFELLADQLRAFLTGRSLP